MVKKRLKHSMKEDESLSKNVMGSFKIIPSHKLHKMSPSKYLMASKSRVMVHATTQAWSTKMISLMDGEELSIQVIITSLMHNGMMELNMDTIDLLIKLVSVFNMNIKMAHLLDIFEIINFVMIDLI